MKKAMPGRMAFSFSVSQRHVIARAVPTSPIGYDADYFPSKRGARFSRNAARPSR